MNKLDTAIKNLERAMDMAVSRQPRPEGAEARLPLPLKSPSRSSPAVMPKPRIRDSVQAQNQLSRLLAQTYAALKKYGENADTTEMRDAMFQEILGDYAIADVEKAFLQYLKTAREVPIPADILAIVDPQTQPLSEAVYIRISRKEPCDRDAAEWEYLRQFEGEQFKRLRR